MTDNTNPRNIQRLIDKGFTQAEAEATVKPADKAEALTRLGGAYYVEGMPFYQALTAEHAQKMFTLVTGKQGVATLVYAFTIID